jgi:hypothetical protein
MILFENKEETFGLADIDSDYEMLLAEDLEVSEPVAKLHFNEDRQFDGILPIELKVDCKLPEVEQKFVTVQYTATEIDNNFNISMLDDKDYEADETDDGFVVSVTNLFKLSKKLKAKFTRSVIYPFDNTSKNDKVNKFLENPKKSLFDKIREYVKELVYSVDEYKSIFNRQSARNQATREEKKKKAEDEWRAGRNNLEILRDEIKQNPNVISAEITERPTKGIFTKFLRVIFKGRKIFDIKSNNACTSFMVQRFGDMFNSFKTYNYKLIKDWIMNRYNGEVEREMLKNMSNRERAEYNARKRMSQPKNDDWDDDNDDDKFDTSWLDDEDEKLQASR